jgi:hypothetical protein
VGNGCAQLVFVCAAGKNSNKHWYFPLAGFEIYGTIWSFRKK